MNWLLSPAEREQQDDECDVSPFDSPTSRAGNLAKQVSPGMFMCLARWDKGAAEAAIGSLRSSLAESVGCCHLGYFLWSSEGISGWHCSKDHQEKEPGPGWTVAACVLDLLCLFLSGGNGEPAAPLVSCSVHRGNGMWEELTGVGFPSVWRIGKRYGSSGCPSLLVCFLLKAFSQVNLLHTLLYP